MNFRFWWLLSTHAPIHRFAIHQFRQLLSGRPPAFQQPWPSTGSCWARTCSQTCLIAHLQWCTLALSWHISSGLSRVAWNNRGLPVSMVLLIHRSADAVPTTLHRQRELYSSHLWRVFSILQRLHLSTHGLYAAPVFVKLEVTFFRGNGHSEAQSIQMDTC